MNKEKAQILYEKGNAYRREQRWGDALNAYSEAVKLDPDSPARHAYEMLVQIMEYRCKDYYNP
ncbi:MAG: tetratricopeptide repeat protein [Bacteroidaceae bacterium]|nr:tetratricopeptide repeat protein [Bacteroidaceae bacterium]